MINNTTQVQSSLITDTTVSIIRPISEQIGFKVLEYLGIVRFFKDVRTYNIYYHNDIEALSKFRDDSYKAKVTHNRADITIEPIFNPAEVAFEYFNFNHDLITGLNKNMKADTYPVFKDSRAKIELHEYSIPASIKLTYSIKVKELEQIDLIRSAIYTKFNLHNFHKYNSITYQYSLPNYLLLVLYKLYNMKNISESLSFKEYIKIGSNNGIITVRDKTQTDQFQLYIDKPTVFCLGKLSYEYGQSDKDKKNQVVDRYAIEFTYDIQFGKPHLLQLSYPVSIDNQLIPEELITNKKENISKKELHPEKSFNAAYRSSATDRTIIKNQYPTIIFPLEDSLITKKTPLTLNNHIIFQAILKIEQSQSGENYIDIRLKEDVFPLLSADHDIGALETFMLLEKRNIFSNYEFVTLLVFRDDVVVEKSKINLDEDLRLLILDNISINSTYRLVITLNTRLQSCNKEVIKELLTYNQYTSLILQNNLNFLIQKKYIKTVIDNSNSTINGYIPTTSSSPDLPESQEQHSEVPPQTSLLNPSDIRGTKYFIKDSDIQGRAYDTLVPFRIGNIFIYPNPAI